MNDSITLVVCDEQHTLRLGDGLALGHVDDSGETYVYGRVRYEVRDGERGLAFTADDGWTITVGDDEIAFAREAVV